MTAGVHIAIFLPSLSGGGAQRVMLDVARCLADRGDRVSLLVGSAEGEYGGQVPDSVELVDLGVRRMSWVILPLVRWLRRQRPEVLCATLAHANVMAFLAVRVAGVPLRLVLREANTPSFSARRSRKEALVTRLAAFTYRRADAVIAGSQGVADELETIGVPSERLHVLANPVDSAAIRAAAAETPAHPWLQSGSVAPVVLAVGRLSRQKGFDVLLNAFARLRVRSGVRLLILGEGEARTALLRQAHALGIGDTVDLPGFVDNPYSYMARADVFVLSSRWEGLPNVLIQALACGCRCVSTDCPSGPGEILVSGRFGRLVPVEDPEALATAIESMLGEKADASALRRRASDYDVDALAPAWRRILVGTDILAKEAG